MTPFDAAIRGAHEIALPVVAMTITLAAVYAPIGFVSGVTGTLFREFAFTLAGAVIVSGFIALTLSPMMCSKLLRHETGTAGRFGAFVDRTFEGLRRAYQRRLVEFAQLPRPDVADPGRRAGDDRRHVYDDAARAGAGGGPGLSDRPDQGAAIRQPRLRRAGDASASIPRRVRCRRSSTPSWSTAIPTCGAGFAGMILKPWDQRTRDQKAGAGGAGAEVPRRAGGAGAGLRAAVAARLDRRRADAVRHPHHRRLSDARRRRGEDAAGGARQRAVPVHRRRPQVRHAAICRQHRRQQGQPHRPVDVGHRRDAVDHAGRQLRQPVQPARPQLSGDPAGAARLPPDARVADALPVAHQQRRAGAAVGGGDGHREGAAQRADQLPAAQLGDAVGRAVPRPHARRGARLPQGQGEGDLPRGLFL